MTKIVLLGASGQLGDALMNGKPEGVVLIGATHEVLDVRDPEAVLGALGVFYPDVVVNCAAYTKVDEAESEPGATTSWQVNALGARNVARACREVNARLIHLSTDYIFGGRGGDAVFFEDAQPDPLNVYGVTKLAGERFVQQELPGKCAVVRTSGLFGGRGDFVSAILKQAMAGDRDAPIRVVNDQTTSPTYAPDLAARLYEIAESGGTGLFHVTNADRCSWFDFAREIIDQVGGDTERVVPISTSELGRAARRPEISVLRTHRPGKPLRAWYTALNALMTQPVEVVV